MWPGKGGKGKRQSSAMSENGAQRRGRLTGDVAEGREQDLRVMG